MFLVHHNPHPWGCQGSCLWRRVQVVSREKGELNSGPTVMEFQHVPVKGIDRDLFMKVDIDSREHGAIARWRDRNSFLWGVNIYRGLFVGSGLEVEPWWSYIIWGRFSLHLSFVLMFQGNASRARAREFQLCLVSVVHRCFLWDSVFLPLVPHS